MKPQSNKVVKYKRPSRFHFITVVFGAILVYLVVQLVGYLTQNNIQVFEVEPPITSSVDSSYTGIIYKNRDKLLYGYSWIHKLLYPRGKKSKNRLYRNDD